MIESASDSNLARIQNAVDAIASIDGVFMEPVSLVADLLDMARTYGDAFEETVDNLCKALKDVKAVRVDVSPMKYDYADYQCYHFQSSARRGHPADMRVLFKRFGDGIEILAFGNRHVPSDFYARVLSRLPR